MNLAGVFHFASKDGVMDERISCTVDELAEALAALGVSSRDPDQDAKDIAAFLKADRMPEPVADPSEDWIYE